MRLMIVILNLEELRDNNNHILSSIDYGTYWIAYVGAFLNTMGVESEVSDLSSSLRNEIIDCKTEPDIERSKDLLEALSKHHSMPIAILQKTRAGNTLAKCVKTLKRHKRTSNEKEGLEGLIHISENLLKKWKDSAAKEENMAKKKESEAFDKAEGLPTSTKEYLARLQKQRKELFKNPPALPPDHVQIEEKKCPLPKRDKKTGELTFQCGEDDSIRSLLRDFRPNRTPEEILRAGSFGGTYFRPITSAVTNKVYNADEVLRDSVDPKWIKGLDKKTMLTSATYRNSVNKYGVKCGGSLGMWESSGWIADSDPYGWFQWYCRFYQGRRYVNESPCRRSATLGASTYFRVLVRYSKGARMTCDKSSVGQKVLDPKVVSAANYATRSLPPKPRQMMPVLARLFDKPYFTGDWKSQMIFLRNTRKGLQNRMTRTQDDEIIRKNFSAAG
jgi:hypothetical protein